MNPTPDLQKILESEERYAELLDSAPDAMVVVGEDAVITLVNRQTEALFGYGRAELIGQSHELLIPEEVREQHAGHVRGFFASPKTRSMGSRRLGARPPARRAGRLLSLPDEAGERGRARVRPRGVAVAGRPGFVTALEMGSVRSVRSACVSA
jgi:PAS domain S-box-containing protein